MRLPQTKVPRLRNAGFAVSCAASFAMLALPAAPAHADLQTITGSTSLAQVVMLPQPIPAFGAVGTAFTSYSAVTVPYSTGTFFVSGGTYDFSLASTSGAPVGLFIVSGKFVDSNTSVPSASPANIVAGAIDSPKIQVFSVVLKANQSYTYVVTTPFNTADGWKLQVITTECIVFGGANLCPPRSVANGFSLFYDPAMTMEIFQSQWLAFMGLSSRLDALRYAGDGNEAALVAYSLDSPDTGRAAAGRAPRQGFWARALGTRGTQNAGAAAGGYASRGSGFTAGYDREVAERTTVGVALTYAENSVGYQQQSAGQGTSIKSYHAGVYASHRFEAFYVDAMMGYARQRYGTSRDTLSGTDTGNFSGNLWSARLSAGLPLRVGRNFTLTPQARADYMHATQQAYTENGGLTAIAFDARHAERIRSGLGAQLAYDARLAGMQAQPYVSAFWNHDFHNNGIAGSATQGGVSFQVQGQAAPRNTYSTGVGATFLVNERLSAMVGLDHEAGGGYKSDTAKLTGRWAF